MVYLDFHTPRSARHDSDMVPEIGSIEPANPCASSAQRVEVPADCFGAFGVAKGHCVDLLHTAPMFSAIRGMRVAPVV
jgi:hypothetical protein